MVDGVTLLLAIGAGVLVAFGAGVLPGVLMLVGSLLVRRVMRR